MLYPSAVGLVIQTDSHWFEAVTTQTQIVSTEMTSSGCSTERIEVTVSTPQFPKDNQYSVVFETGEGDRGVKVVERSGNVFVDAAVEYAVKALGEVEIKVHWGLRFLVEVRQSMGFVKDEYCILDEKGVRFTKPVGSVEKTGMGS